MAWTFAAYEPPVGERLWHATASVTTPTALVRALLDSLAGNEPRWPSPFSDRVRRPADATSDLIDAGWTQNSPGRHVHWQAPDGSASLDLDPYAAEHAHTQLPWWTAYGGTDPSRPEWAIQLCPATPPRCPCRPHLRTRPEYPSGADPPLGRCQAKPPGSSPRPVASPSAPAAPEVIATP
ncbi:DUF317 domain-containing protein [Streptomyces sp. BR123]|nr:DUF317 domain-containing protein [Streptomyces sp. BR123]